MRSSFAGEALQAPAADFAPSVRVRSPLTIDAVAQRHPKPRAGHAASGSKPNGLTFKDIAGCEKAKRELAPVVQFFKNREGFLAGGGKAPKGLLLSGPVGVGKTMLARAAANEAGVKLYAVPAAEFVEILMEGPARIQQMFAMLKKKAPCMLFIEGLDVVIRSHGPMGSSVNVAREHAIKQLVAEMDALSSNANVVVIAAASHPEQLDPALLREGRFDHTVTVPPPDAAARLAILQAHAAKLKLADDVDLEAVAKESEGLVGAQLVALLDEAAAEAAEKQKPGVDMEEIMAQLQHVQANAAPKAPPRSKRIQDLIACHEAGHALVAAFLPGYSKVHKVTIVPTGQAGGYTAFEPTEEQLAGLVSRKHLTNDLAVSMGGRVAEELMFGKRLATTGASNDFEQATNLAIHMVQKFGFNSIGPMVMAPSQAGGPGPALQDRIDQDKLALINGAYKRARALLSRHKPLLRELANALLARDTLEGGEVHAMVAKKIRSLSKNPRVMAEVAAAEKAEAAERAKQSAQSETGSNASSAN